MFLFPLIDHLGWLATVLNYSFQPFPSSVWMIEGWNHWHFIVTAGEKSTSCLSGRFWFGDRVVDRLLLSPSPWNDDIRQQELSTVLSSYKPRDHKPGAPEVRKAKEPALVEHLRHAWQGLGGSDTSTSLPPEQAWDPVLQMRKLRLTEVIYLRLYGT